MLILSELIVALPNLVEIRQVERNVLDRLIVGAGDNNTAVEKLFVDQKTGALHQWIAHQRRGSIYRLGLAASAREPRSVP